MAVMAQAVMVAWVLEPGWLIPSWQWMKSGTQQMTTSCGISMSCMAAGADLFESAAGDSGDAGLLQQALAVEEVWGLAYLGSLLPTAKRLSGGFGQYRVNLGLTAPVHPVTPRWRGASMAWRWLSGS